MNTSMCVSGDNLNPSIFEYNITLCYSKNSKSKIKVPFNEKESLFKSFLPPWIIKKFTIIHSMKVSMGVGFIPLASSNFFQKQGFLPSTKTYSPFYNPEAPITLDLPPKIYKTVIFILSIKTPNL